MCALSLQILRGLGTLIDRIETNQHWNMPSDFEERRGRKERQQQDRDSAKSSTGKKYTHTQHLEDPEQVAEYSKLALSQEKITRSGGVEEGKGESTQKISCHDLPHNQRRSNKQGREHEFR